LSLANAEEDRIGASSEGSVVKVFEYPAGYFVYVAFSDELTAGETSSATEFELNFICRKFLFTPNQAATLSIGDNVKNETMEYAARGADGLIYTIGTAETATSSSILLAKVNSATTTPTKIFSKDFGSGTRVKGVSVFPLGGFCYVLADKLNEATGTRDIWVTRVSAFDGSQDQFWTGGVTIGTPANDDYGCRIFETSNGDIVVLGTISITNQKKLALIKLNPIGGFD
jgi:hypothetical protein